MKRLLGTVGLAVAVAALGVGRPLGAQSAPKRPRTVDDAHRLQVDRCDRDARLDGQ